jgi:hypothetical protein
MPMKFDAVRACATFEKLGDPDFAGSDSERLIADFVACELERIGWRVARREVQGSRFPQRAGPWIGWLGYGALNSVCFGVILIGNLLAQLLALLALFAGFRWLVALTANSIRPGRRMPPVEAAPLVIATITGESPAPVRVIFQVVMGGLNTRFLRFFRVPQFWILIVIHTCFFLCATLTVIAMRQNPPLVRGTLLAAWAIFFVAWIMILSVLSWEYHELRTRDETHRADRLGAAFLLELARSWPRRRSQHVEPVCIAAGGQQLNYAGSREVVRMLESEWPRKPALLLLLFAPGAEKEAEESESILRIAGLYTSGTVLAKTAAESLWIPNRSDDWAALFAIWPFEKVTAAEPIALIGSGPGNAAGAGLAPEALDRVAQLAVEITLRWAKIQKEKPATPPPAQTEDESSMLQRDGGRRRRPE